MAVTALLLTGTSAFAHGFTSVVYVDATSPERDHVRATLGLEYDLLVVSAADAEKDDPLVSPLANADLTGLPPATVITAGCDPLHAQGELYAEALRAAGNDVVHRHWPGMVHGFFQLPMLFDDGQEAIDVAGERLRAAL